MLAYYGATMASSTDADCNNDYSTFDTSIVNPFTDFGCINGDGIMYYLENVIGLPEEDALNIRGYFCDTDNPTNTNCNSVDYADLQGLYNLDETYSISVCNGGEMDGKVCTYDSNCPSYEVPNFLNFKNEDEAYKQFLTYSGFSNLKNYVYVNPDQNSVGESFLRISAKDGGLNEDGKYTHKRTGYSKVKVSISGSSQGPEGDLFKEEQASFGIVPDTYI